jgi:hypothetical protein
MRIDFCENDPETQARDLNNGFRTIFQAEVDWVLNSIPILMLRPFEGHGSPRQSSTRIEIKTKQHTTPTNTMRIHSVNGESSGVALDSQNDPRFAGSRRSGWAQSLRLRIPAENRHFDWLKILYVTN